MSLERKPTDLTNLTLSVKNADALILGGPAAEGGDIKVYRDGSGNLQLAVNADAASNGEALIIYGGVVAQNYLTVGKTSVDTSSAFYVDGSTSLNGGVNTNGYPVSGATGLYFLSNYVSAFIDIPISSGTATHDIQIRIDGNDIIVVQATGDGAGGITNKAIGLYGVTPVTQASAISDPAESTAANNAAIDSILAALRAIGLIAT